MLACLEVDRACGARLLGIIEQQELHSARVSRKHAEVDAVGENGGTQGKTSAGAGLACRWLSREPSLDFREIGGHVLRPYASTGLFGQVMNMPMSPGLPPG